MNFFIFLFCSFVFSCFGRPHPESFGKMVKKPVDWKNTQCITTPSQMKHYIEACKDWLLALSDAENDDEEEFPTQPLPFITEEIQSDNIGLIREQIYETNVFSCFLCKRKETVSQGRIVVANPFTISQCMLVCNSCKN